jgi:hypothetical protein
MEENNFTLSLEPIRKFVEETTGVTLSARNIQAISVSTQMSGKGRIEVGKYLDPRFSHFRYEIVLAVFETDPSCKFIVCTNARGAWHDQPYIFGEKEVYQVEEQINNEEPPAEAQTEQD